MGTRSVPVTDPPAGRVQVQTLAISPGHQLGLLKYIHLRR